MKKLCQKNLLFLYLFFVLFFLFSFPSFSLASVNFDLPSARVINTAIIPTCTTGDTISLYDHTGTLYDVAHVCNGATSFTATLADTYTWVECDSTVPLANCGDGTLSLAIADSGFISQGSFTFVDSLFYSTVGTCPALQICYYDWLLVNSLIIFFLAIISFGFFINFFPKADSRYIP